MYNLCKHPEYLQPLREEIERSGGVILNHQNDEMPLMDSFLKETARMNPVTICTNSPFLSSLAHIPDPLTFLLPSHIHPS